ncbi:PREDICTED: uncharacterized protein LOC107103522 [Cyprinodon variegatus]|uniref:uncharacterized protein LOC107103522 n=1 Tax=Cyprinodon variegatus TaxID=28743 RepID=UPI00074259CF|nr:PREDICTED: uncharacterized protein LOC107103522 [Cyprinodon variegatus]
MENLVKEMKHLSVKKILLLDEAYQLAVKLYETNTVEANITSTHVLLDFLIQKMKERGDQEKVKKLEEMNKMDDRTRAALIERKPNILLKFGEIIANSHKIDSECPAIYDLPTKIEKTGNLTKVTVGRKNEKPNRTILLVGETGRGKSTLIKALVNYSMGVKFEDKIWFQIVEEDEGRSQKSDVVVYQIFGFEDHTLPFSLTIIDTPGYGDTRGIQHDDEVSQMLFSLFQSEDGVPDLHAVGLVMKASDHLVSDRLQYIFNSVVSLFGPENTVALITHSDGMPPHEVLKALEKANIECSKDTKNQIIYFMFNNQQKTQRTEENEFGLENAWRVSERGINRMTTYIKDISPKNIRLMFETLTERARLTACIQNLEERIRFTELKQKDINMKDEALKKHKEKNKSEQFTAEVAEVFKTLKPFKSGPTGWVSEAAVYCTVCEENCHYPGCTMGLSPERCEVMKNGSCTSCSCKCPASKHMKDNQKYVIRSRKVLITERTLSQKYEQNLVVGGNRSGLLENVIKEMQQLSAEKILLLDEAYQLAVKLYETSTVKANIASTHVLLDFLIQKMKERGDQEKVKKLEEMNNKMDDRTRAALMERMKGIKWDEDLISESFEIQSELPAVYQLRTKKEKFGTLTRVIYGQKDEKKPNRTILLVGETGTGKSTLINALVNYAMGVKFEDEVWFQIVEEENRSQTESQTSDVIVYQIFEGQNLPFSLTVINTPGFGYTTGSEHDLVVSQRLFDLFLSKDGVQEIHAVGLVMKASENRLSDRLKYIFESLMALFGKDLEKNIVALVTHSYGRKPKYVLKALEVADIKCAKDRNNQPVYFLFNNYEMTERDTEETAVWKRFWDFTNTEIQKFTTYLNTSQPQTLTTTMEFWNERIRLTACIQNLQERVKLSELKQKDIKQIQEALKNNEKEIKNNKNFSIEIDETYKDKEPISGRMWGLVFFEGAVCCTRCEENCHYPGCTMAWYPEHCEVMKEGRCTVCTGKCPASDHVNEQWRYVTKTRKAKKTLQDMREKYENNKAKCENMSSLLENLKEESRKLSAETLMFLHEAYQHAVKIKSVSTCVHLDFLIDKLEKKDDTWKAEKLKKMKSEKDEKETMPVRHYMKAVSKAEKKKVT